jgi:photosystem II stability/assembly factor-like uncharacterized protein
MNLRSALVMAAVFFAAASSVFSQSWHQTQNLSANYYAVRQQFLDFWKDKKPQKGQGHSVFRRWEWHWQSRIMPDGSFPPSNIKEVEWNNYLASLPENKISTAANWTSMGPSSSNSGYNGIGRVNCVALHPTNSDILWIGAATGGVWKSSDGGASWAPLTDNLKVLSVTSIAVSPLDPNTIYIGTGDGNGNQEPSVGVLKSTDGGATWNTTGLTWNLTFYKYIRRIIVHPSSPDTVLVAASDGIYRTENGGANWKKVTVDDFFEIQFNPADPNIVYAASDDKFYKSTDIGATWAVSFEVPNSDRLSLAVTPANPAMVAAVSSSNETDNFGAFNGLYVSTDTGNTYELRSDFPNLLGWDTEGLSESGQGWYDLCIAISPTNPDLIFVGAVNLWKSEDGGYSWSLATHWYDPGDGTPVVHADKHALLWVGNTLFNGCDGGLYKTNNDGATWTDISSNLAISQMYRLGVSQSSNKVICGLQDNGTKLRGNTGVWTDELGGDGMECFIHPTNPNTMYGESQNGRINRSTNGGVDWTFIYDNLPGEPDGAWITPFVIDPNNSTTIYVGYNNVYKSTNQGNTWEQITPPDLNIIFDLQHIAVAPSSSDTIYISDGDQVFKTTDAGATWSTVTGNLPTANFLTYLSVDPSNANIVYVTFGGYTPNSKVFKTVNGGASWMNISTGLPNLPANCVIVQPNTGVLYLGMDVGVYRREPGAASWEIFNTGLPNVIVNELEIRKSTGKIFAATYGRGLWQSDLAPFVPSLSLNAVNLNFPAAGGQQTFGLTTNCNWSATNIPSWLTISPSSGAAGTFNVTVTAAANASLDSQAVVITFSGCNGQATQNLTVTQQGLSVGVEDLNGQSCNSVACIPNPASESASFLIQTDHSQTVHLDILTADGHVVVSWKNIALKAGENNIPWQLNDLPSGNYFFRCFFENEIESGRIVLMR